MKLFIENDEPGFSPNQAESGEQFRLIGMQERAEIFGRTLNIECYPGSGTSLLWRCPMSIRILITDDHGVIRAALRALLEMEPNTLVVGEASTGEEAVRMTGQCMPDIILMDIGLSGMDGIETTRQIKKLFPQVNVLILSVYEDESLLREAIRAGASGYIIKRSAAEDLMAAIQAVSRGDMYIHPAFTRLLVANFSAGKEPVKDRLESLTHREIEVMGYIIRGFTNRQIGEALCISTRTVEGHRASLFGKLSLRNKVELVEFAEKNNLFDFQKKST